jgi:hypothetical protein
LLVVVLRVYSLEKPHELPYHPEMAGCRSWVDLGHRLSTHGVRPVLDDATFREQARTVRRRLQAIRHA